MKIRIITLWCEFILISQKSFAISTYLSNYIYVGFFGYIIFPAVSKMYHYLLLPNYLPLCTPSAATNNNNKDKEILKCILRFKMLNYSMAGYQFLSNRQQIDMHSSQFSFWSTSWILERKIVIWMLKLFEKQGIKEMVFNTFLHNVLISDFP